MGKATRWLKGLLGMKKEKENDDKFSNYAQKKEKKRWSFARSGKVPVEEVVGMNIPANIPVSSTDAAWIRSFMSESEKEQNKHAIAVAAATAAAADAAVAAAQAAVAVVRLTSHGRAGGGTALLFNGGREKLAAIKIQTFFRGYLARKAHRALKGLVKLQALVRGYLVRKRTAATLHSMQALIRAQSAVRSQRARRSSISCDYRYPPEIRARRSIERFDNEFHSKRLSCVQYDNGFDDSPKIVEIDTYKPKSRSRRITNNNNSMSDSFGGVGEDQNFHQQAMMMSSPLPFPFSGPAAAIPARLSIPDCRNFQEFDWSFIGEECNRFAAASATAHSTPRFGNTGRTNIPVTPSKSVCGDSFFRPYSNCPSYMANTQSFNAKLRSHSAPKQRPEPVTGPGQKKRLSLNEIMASRSSFTGVRMQKPPRSQVQEELDF